MLPGLMGRYLYSEGCNPEILLHIAAMKHKKMRLIFLKNLWKWTIWNCRTKGTLNEELEAFELDTRRIDAELINFNEANTEKL